MSEVVVQPVSTRRQRKLFLNFPWELYRGDPNWVPPIRMDEKELVGYAHHPFYRRNRAQTFLAYRDGRVCGRICAILNEDHNQRYGERRGFWGFFESVDDPAVSDALFDAVKAHFAAQGIRKLRGPMNPGINYALGLLVEGFDSPPMFLMTYNPPYYGKLVERAGFRKAQDMYAYAADVSMLPAAREKLSPVANQIIERYNVQVRPMNKKRFRQDVEAFLEIYNRSMDRLWSFTPLSKEEVAHLARSLRWLMIPELAVGAEIDGRMVGTALCLLDYNPRIRKIGGRLFPFGLLRLLWNRRKIKSVRLIAANVLPEYHLMGIGLVLLHGLLPHALAWGVEDAEFSWVMESNAASRGSLEKGGTRRSKTYRIYDWEGEGK